MKAVRSFKCATLSTPLWPGWLSSMRTSGTFSLLDESDRVLTLDQPGDARQSDCADGTPVPVGTHVLWVGCTIRPSRYSRRQPGDRASCSTHSAHDAWRPREHGTLENQHHIATPTHLCQQWRIWWIEHGLTTTCRDTVTWDSAPKEYPKDAKWHVHGKRIFNDILEDFRDEQCYIGANALTVVWRARSALREHGMFHPKIIRYVIHALCVCAR